VPVAPARLLTPLAAASKPSLAEPAVACGETAAMVVRAVDCDVDEGV
jgi:hypothetical protein